MDPVIHDVLRRQLPRLPRADQHRRTFLQSAENLLRQLHGGKTHRHGSLTDARLCSSPLADLHRRLQQFIQHGSRQVLASSDLKRIPHLSQDLLLPDDHRIQPRCHPEQVFKGLSITQPIQIGLHLVQGHGSLLGQEPMDHRIALSLLLHQRIDLTPVARRKNISLLDLAMFHQLPQDGRPLRLLKDQPIPDRHGSGFVT